ncbi:hypothetical protein OPT61_g3896 [Boeremia exigua]|uniref:Uncharacterized protein n=1 Tax=Boeremia exigua TaxID=749465 RepID=A0ACC2IGA4_9PLEO|nr:hypothetical protein OPT61_g3896 [Boeremia exigua]
MHAFTLVAALAPVVLAQTYSPHLCGGMGGCPRNGAAALPDRPLRCPDGTRANLLEVNRVESSIWEGNYRIITKEEFPATCKDNFRPGPNDTLFVSEVLPGQKAYGFVSGTCSDRTSPVTAVERYVADPNLHVYSVCDVQDLSGARCEPFMGAGRCETFGPRPDGLCATWAPDQVEEPCFNEATGSRCG